MVCFKQTKKKTKSTPRGWMEKRKSWGRIFREKVKMSVFILRNPSWGN
jgi:hypothetical protein